MYTSAMPGENPVQMATEIPIQSPTEFTGPIQPEMQPAPDVDPQEQLASVMNTLLGHDGANEGFNLPPDRQEIPQQNFVPPPSTFGSNYENELISQFKSLLDEKLHENNRRLTDMLKSELLQTYRCSPKQQTVRTPTTIRTPKEESHTQSDNAVADSFINYDNADNAYHVSMSPMVNVDFVYVPLLIQGLHWFLGVFNLVDYMLTIYDSLLSFNALEKESADVVCHINFVFDHWLRIHGYNADIPLPFNYPFELFMQPLLLSSPDLWETVEFGFPYILTG
ncbi:putative Ulp1 protease family catalytic domain, papain-like cysteine peptidase superfamily [Helianthus annuus]|nr:putative Ulp1 protease family catalytic domain, papain-like cysteine peptidase superfamily [Helianthus annuus]